MELLQDIFFCKSGDDGQMSSRFNKIHHQWLKFLDPNLYLALCSSGIEPQLYLLKWFRLLFLREFSFSQVFLVWDFFFKSQSQFESDKLIPLDFFSLAMLLSIRQDLLNTCLESNFDPILTFNKLTTYPPLEDISVLLELANSMMSHVSFDGIESSTNGAKDGSSIVSKCGYLTKVGGGTAILGRKSKKSRWFVLQGDKLSYFSNESSNVPLKNRRIFLKNKFDVRIIDIDKFGFEVYPIEQDLSFSADNGNQESGKASNLSSTEGISSTAVKEDDDGKDRSYKLYASSFDDMMHWISSFKTACHGNLRESALYEIAQSKEFLTKENEAHQEEHADHIS